ncbi:MAG: diaminopimelate decarboxylase [Defluviitaleaceae bacterium]|nr:diaminopimelate decarboxylase [Defluviitaleaceae bacterium]
MNPSVTQNLNFYQGHNPASLTAAYGSPLYVYNENIFRQRCRDMVNLTAYPHFKVNYAIKANTNLTLLAIAKEEGLCADISSPGEGAAALAAGFAPQDLFFIANNISTEEMTFAIEKGITLSVDSISQLETYGKLNPGGQIALRFNGGVGGGHHEKVVTGGDKTKFGIRAAYIPETKALLAKYNLQLVGINHHSGSQNPEELYLSGVKELLSIARRFDNLEFIDFGGGFSIPYHKQEGEAPMDLAMLGNALTSAIEGFVAEYGKPLTFMIEPGRYICAECGVLLGTVHAAKQNGETKFAGTDLGFSVLARTTLYDAHHDIEVYPQPQGSICRGGNLPPAALEEKISIVGNQCESGDYIAKSRLLPPIKEGDILGILDAGAYGYSMSSQYNHRARPAEVLIQSDSSLKLIRRRDTYEGMLANMQNQNK